MPMNDTNKQTRFPRPSSSLLSQQTRSGPDDLPWEEIQTPAYVIDMRYLEDNARLLAEVAETTGATVLLAQKSFSGFRTYPLLSKYLSGTCASGEYEALLAHEFWSEGENHVFSPAFRDGEMERVLPIADHLIFNSFTQWARYKDSVLKEMSARPPGRPLKAGLRINPEYSEVDTSIYDPAGPASRLGLTLANFEMGVREYGLDGISGLHVHTLCEQNSDALANTVRVMSQKFDPYLQEMEWLNLGGGHHITRMDYDLDLLGQVISELFDQYNFARIYLEPGEAVTLDCGWLVASVIDTIHNDLDIALLDTSATCHMPDVLEMPYRPRVYRLDSEGMIDPLEATETATEETPYLYRLGGPTCLAGDIIGDYAFSLPLNPGDKLIFCDMALYTMVKTNTFNGMPLPSIYHFDGETPELIRTFGYEDFKERLG